jgi:hypothetical protein
MSKMDNIVKFFSVRLSQILFKRGFRDIFFFGGLIGAGSGMGNF